MRRRAAAEAGGGRGGGGGMGGPWGGFGGSGDFEKVPKERRGRTLRRIVAFFKPYKAQVAVVLVAILLTSFIGLINPILLKLLIDIAIPERDWGLLNLFVGLMIVLPIISGVIGVGQSYLNNVIGQSVMHDLRTELYAHLQKMPLRFFTETRTGEIQSRLANDVGGIQSVVTDTAASLTSNIAIAISTVIAMLIIDWRLTFLSLALLPFFMYLTFRVGKVNREVRGETQKSLAEMSAVTEETLSVSGMLLSKTFGQQGAAIGRFSKLNRELATLQVRQAMVGRWFFMIIGTIFSITPAFVYWLAGFLAIQGDPTRPDDRRHRRVHDAPEPALLPARPAARRPGRDPGRAGPVRSDLRVPRDGPRDRRCARCGRARPLDDPRQRPIPGCLVPLPGRGGSGVRRDGGGRRGDGNRGRGTARRPRDPAHPAVRARGDRLRGQCRSARRPGRTVGLRQDDDDVSRAAALRRRYAGRSRSMAATSGR